MAAQPAHPFHEFFLSCRAHGWSPASCLDEGAVPQRLPAAGSIRDAREEAVFRERMPEVFADIAACLRRNGETAAMTRALYSQCLDGALDTAALRWLDSSGYSLDWLFFGVGGMRKSGYSPALAAGDGRPVPLDAERVRRMRERLPGWSGADWAWLLGGRFLRKRGIAPSMAITARAVAGWGIPPFIPAMPDPAALCLRVQRLAAGIDPGNWRREDWRGYVIRRLRASPARAGMLAGMTPATTRAYLSGAARPTSCALRAFLVLDFILTRHGRDGLLDLLELLDEEARCRGFASLGEVFRRRAWSPGPGTGRDKDGTSGS